MNVRPYQYPYFQKTKIEKLVNGMLHEGIIRPSTNPFSSPVILVKKNDSTWKFCVDYLVLNVVTIRDRFPISIFKELFDELAGALGFLKDGPSPGFPRNVLWVDECSIDVPDVNEFNLHISDAEVCLGLLRRCTHL